MLNSATKDLDDEPGSLEEGQCLLKGVLFAFVPDLFGSYGGKGYISMGDQVMELFRVDRKLCAMFGLEDEATHVCIKAMAHGPFVVT